MKGKSAISGRNFSLLNTHIDITHTSFLRNSVQPDLQGTVNHEGTISNGKTTVFSTGKYCRRRLDKLLYNPRTACWRGEGDPLPHSAQVV